MNLARQHLLQVYQAALAAVNGESCTRRALADYVPDSPLAVIAIGKAASSMMQGALAALGDKLHAGLLITKQGHCDESLRELKNICCLESAHPVPDERSLAAGQTLLSFMAEHAVQGDFVFLISGGASSLVEVLPSGVSLEDLQSLNEWLLGSGLPIDEMNYLRQSISCIKGGRLAQQLAGRTALCLMVSDVPGDFPQVIGSGLLCAGDGQELQFSVMPEWFKKLPKADAAPTKNDACFTTVELHLIATLDDAMQTAKTSAHALGYTVELHRERVTGDAEIAGQNLARSVSAANPAFHIWGGETTLRLPQKPGRGGRSQHLALSAALELADSSSCYFLAIGTDGSDGPTKDAGALVDGHSIQRGTQAGFDAQQTLASANSGSFLQASGDLIRTGPTGTNVMDLILSIKLP
jgi:glycerate 2-kinase